MKKKACLYSRVSSVAQCDGYSLDYQDEQYFKFCERNNYQSSNDLIYREEGVSGAKESRPQLDRLLEDAKNGKFDILLVHKIDRLARSQRVFLNIESKLSKHGIGFRSMTEEFNTTTAMGKYAMQNMSAIAELERGMIRERTITGQIQAKKDGKWHGLAPYGYDYDKETKKLMINKQEAKWVRKMYQWFVDERMTQRNVQARLNDLKIPTKYDNLGKSKKTNKNYWWGLRTVGRILENEVYSGQFTFRKYKRMSAGYKDENLRPKEDWIVVKTPRIVSVRLFNSAQKQKAKNKLFATRKAKNLYLLGGLIYCGECGSKYGSCYHKNTNRTGRNRYYCQGKLKWVRKDTCNSSSVGEKRLEPPIWDNIKKIISDPETVIKYLEKIKNKNNDISAIKSSIIELDTILKNSKEKEGKLLDLYLEKQLSKELYYSRKSELESRISKAQVEFDSLTEIISLDKNKNKIKNDLETMFKRYKTNLDNISPEQKREVYKMIVDKVVVTKDDVEVSCSIPFMGDNQGICGDRQSRRA